MAVPPEKAGQADLRIPAILIGSEIHLLVLDSPPQPFHQDVVKATLPARPADLDLVLPKPCHEVGRRQLAALVRMEDPGLAPTPQGHLQGLQTELRVKAVGELPAEHMPGVKINDGRQVEEAFPQRNVGVGVGPGRPASLSACLLYTSDAADE